MDDILTEWKKAKTILPQSPAIDQLVKDAGQKRKASRNFHYGNILVLSATVMALLIFFVWLLQFRETLSHVGVAIMIGSLVIRIVLEFYSAQRTKAINYSVDATDSMQRTINFHTFRKAVHGWVTISIVVVYCIGLGLLTPELYKHLGAIILLFDGLFLLSGIFIIVQVRKSIRKEMNDLENLISIKSQLQDS